MTKSSFTSKRIFESNADSFLRTARASHQLALEINKLSKGGSVGKGQKTKKKGFRKIRDKIRGEKGIPNIRCKERRMSENAKRQPQFTVLDPLTEDTKMSERRRTADKISKRDSGNLSEVTEEDPSPLPSSDSGESKQVITKPPSARLSLSNSDAGDGQSTLRHPYHNLYSASSSRNSSARTSTSSLQALNEDTIVDARSVRRPPMSRRTSGMSQSDKHSQDLPVYPDQSYASLQSQVHPTYQPPFSHPRSAPQSHHDIRSRLAQSRAARTAGNTPVSSPGLFSFKTPSSTTSFGTDDGTRVSTPYLHPTHLQPPKE